MARIDNLQNFLTDVAGAIKTKKEYSEDTKILASEFDNEILSIPLGENLDEQLAEQDRIIAELQEAVKNKAGGGGKPNIFVQEEEPETKNGIWLKANKEVSHYTYDDDVFIGGKWGEEGSKRAFPYDFIQVGGNGAVSVGTNIYTFGGTYSSYSNYKYDTLTDTYTSMTDIPYEFRNGSVSAINTDIYLFGGTYSKRNTYKYDTLTDTYTQMTNIPYDFLQGITVVVGTDIYLISGNNSGSYNYKYDTLTDTYTKMTKTPGTTIMGCAVAVIGNDIHIFGGSTSASTQVKHYKYDTLTDVYTALNDVPIRVQYSSATAIGTNIYIFGGTISNQAAYKYDSLTNEYIEMQNIPIAFTQGSAVAVGTKIYLFSNKNVQVYATMSKTYNQDNLVVINQGRYAKVGYLIELYSNSKDVDAPKYAFADAWYYTKTGGLETNIPTYYGNGTEWIKIRGGAE